MTDLTALYNHASQQFNIPQIFEHTRSDLGMSMRQLAEALGVSKGFISLIESGNRAPSTELIKQLHKLNEDTMSLKKLLEYVEENTTDMSELADVATIRKCENGKNDPYYKLCVRNLRRKFRQ